MQVVSLGAMHLKSCIELDRLSLNGLWSEQQWEKELTDPQRICLGTFRKKVLIGMISSWIVLDELYLTAIAVHPDYRRQGIAKTMLTSLLEQAKLTGVSYVSLEVDSSNTAANMLYKSYGFKVNGFRAKYYKDGGDAFIQGINLKD